MLNLDRTSADDLVNLFLDLFIRIRMLEKLVECKRQQARRSLMASNEKSNELVRDILIRELLPRLRIHAVEHGSQQILPITGILLSRRDNLTRRPLHSLDISSIPLIRSTVQKPRRKGRSTVSDAGLCEEVTHGLDKRVHVITIV